MLFILHLLAIMEETRTLYLRFVFLFHSISDPLCGGHESYLTIMGRLYSVVKVKLRACAIATRGSGAHLRRIDL